MKKIYTTAKWKSHQKSKNAKALRRRSEKKRKEHNTNKKIEKHRAKKREELKRQGIISPHIVRKNLNPKNPKKHKNLPSPPNFSFINNTEKVIDYLNLAEKTIRERKQIIFDISEITDLTPDAITLLIAKINHKKFNRGIQIQGNAPKNEQLRTIFIESDFYSYVHSKIPKYKKDNNLLLHKETNNKVEPKIAKEACLIGIRHTFQNEEIYEPLYNILIEAMQNTNNHADLDTRGKYDWWLYVYGDPITRITSYSFLDLGVGIFESLPVQNWRRNFLTKLNISSNLDLVDKLFAGEISSRTGKGERGKGLPQIYQCAQDQNIKEFKIISNDVYADLKNNQHRKLSTTFAGTLLYWEIKP